MRALALSLSLVLLAPVTAGADERRPPEVQRPNDATRTSSWNVSRPGKAYRYGHAEALVDAPAEKIRDTAVRFELYRDLHRKFASARVVGRHADATDVSMRLDVRLGPFTFEQWAVMRFGRPSALSGGVHVVEGRALKGNMKDAHMIITVKAVDGQRALLQVDLLFVPSLPAPRALVEEELRDAACDLVNGLKARARA